MSGKRMLPDAEFVWDDTGADEGHGGQSAMPKPSAGPKWFKIPRPYWGALFGALSLAFVSLIGGSVAATYPVTYSTERMLIVVPSKTAPVDQAASLFDSLSRGQVVATVAEILEQPRWRSEAPDVVITAGSVTPSSVIQVTASGQDRDRLAPTLDSVVSRARPEANRLLAPYEVLPLSQSTSDVRAVGLTRPVRFALVALAAAVTAGLVAQLTRSLGESRKWGEL